jgi:hypothetical protein
VTDIRMPPTFQREGIEPAKCGGQAPSGHGHRGPQYDDPDYEPTGALDRGGGQEGLELFRRLHGNGQPIMMVAHDSDVAVAAQCITEVRNGRVTDESRGALTSAAAGVAS